MTVISRLSNRVVTNPIEWHETLHQLRSLPMAARRYWFVMPITLTLVVAVIALTLVDMSAQTRNIAIYAIWIVHMITASRAISVGANAISREHVGKTWDSLVLTGLSRRQILMGKWLGVLNRTAGWMLILGAVRLVMLPVFMLKLLYQYSWYNGGYIVQYNGEQADLVGWVAWASVLAVVMSVVLSVLEVMACTALGMAASAWTRRGWTAMITAFCIRLIPVALFAGFTRYQIGGGPYWRVLSFPALSLADAGTGPLWQLALPLTGWTRQTHVNALPGLAASTLMLMGFMTVALLVTWWAIRRDGALASVSE